MGWMARVQLLSGARNCFLIHSIQTAFGSTQPPVQWVMEVFCLEMKWQGHQADHDFHIMPGSRLCLLKHRGNFIFTFILNTSELMFHIGTFYVPELRWDFYFMCELLVSTIHKIKLLLAMVKVALIKCGFTIHVQIILLYYV